MPRDREISLTDTTMDSPLSSLLRSLFLYGVEHCAMSGANKNAIYSKEQIVSFMERGNADTKVVEAMEMLSGGCCSGGACHRALGPLAPVLLVTRTGVEVVPAETIPDAPGAKMTGDTPVLLEEEPGALKTPEWWGVPLPIAMYSENVPLLNPTAERLFEGISLPRLSRKKRLVKEFLLPVGNRQFLFSEVERFIFIVQEVTEDIMNADRMAWMASVGQAFISDLKCKGKSVRQIRSSERPSDYDEGSCLSCIWEDNLLGYLCIDDVSRE